LVESVFFICLFFIVLWCALFYVIGPVSCVPNVALYLAGLSILDCTVWKSSSRTPITNLIILYLEYKR
jgi:hypothetical protein